MNKFGFDTREESEETIKNTYSFALSICHPLMVSKVIEARRHDLRQNQIKWEKEIDR